MAVDVLVEQVAEPPRAAGVAGLRAEGAQPHEVARLDLDRLEQYLNALERADSTMPLDMIQGMLAASCGSYDVNRAIMSAPTYAYGTFRTFFTQVGLDGSLLSDVPSGPPPVDDTSGSEMLPDDLLGLASLVAFNQGTGALSTAALREAVSAREGVHAQHLRLADDPGAARQPRRCQRRAEGDQRRRRRRLAARAFAPARGCRWSAARGDSARAAPR